MIALVAVVNIVGFTGSRRQGWLVALTGADLLLQFLLIVVGLVVVWDPGGADRASSTSSATPSARATSPTRWSSRWSPWPGSRPPPISRRTSPGASEDLRNVLRAGSIVVPFVYVGMALVALMALPVVDRARRAGDGPRDHLRGRAGAGGHRRLRARSGWPTSRSGRSSRSRPLILLFAANATMLGLSRHVYVLATNRQIPSWLGKLGKRRSTPHVAILIAAADGDRASSCPATSSCSPGSSPSARCWRSRSRTSR